MSKLAYYFVNIHLAETRTLASALTEIMLRCCTLWSIRIAGHSIA